MWITLLKLLPSPHLQKANEKNKQKNIWVAKVKATAWIYVSKIIQSKSSQQNHTFDIIPEKNIQISKQLDTGLKFQK